MKDCDNVVERLPNARLMAPENQGCENLCEGLELEVLHSGAGYYIGTFHPEEGPTCRVSNYYPTEELALAELNDAKARV